MAPAESGQLEAASGSTTSQLPKREQYISSADRKRERITKIFTWSFLLGIIGGSIYLGRPLEKEEQERMGWGDVHLSLSLESKLTDRYPQDIPH
jgi:hypothetical protein